MSLAKHATIMHDHQTVIAEAIVEAGYGTESYSEEDGCIHECYASIVEVISGDWSEYEDVMSHALNNDFDLGFNFDKYRVRVMSDGSRTKTIIAR